MVSPVQYQPVCILKSGVNNYTEGKAFVRLTGSGYIVHVHVCSTALIKPGHLSLSFPFPGFSARVNRSGWCSDGWQRGSYIMLHAWTRLGRGCIWWKTYPTTMLGIRLGVGEDPIALAPFSSLSSVIPCWLLTRALAQFTYTQTHSAPFLQTADMGPG